MREVSKKDSERLSRREWSEHINSRPTLEPLIRQQQQVRQGNNPAKRQIMQPLRSHLREGMGRRRTGIRPQGDRAMVLQTITLGLSMSTNINTNNNRPAYCVNRAKRRGTGSRVPAQVAGRGCGVDRQTILLPLGLRLLPANLLRFDVCKILC